MDQNNNNELNNQNNNQDINGQLVGQTPVSEAQPVNPVQQPMIQQDTLVQSTNTIQQPDAQPENPVQQSVVQGEAPVQQPVSYSYNPEPAPKTPIILIIILVLAFLGIGFRLFLGLTATKTTLDVRDEMQVKTTVEEAIKVINSANNKYLTNMAGFDKSSKPTFTFDLVSNSGNKYSCDIYGLDDLEVSSLNSANGNYATVVICEDDESKNMNIIYTYANSRYYFDGYYNFSKDPVLDENVKKGKKPNNLIYVTSETTTSEYETLKNSIASLLD